MGMKTNIKRFLFTFTLMLLLSICSFMIGFFVYRVMVYRNESNIFAISYVNLEQGNYGNINLEEFLEW